MPLAGPIIGKNVFTATYVYIHTGNLNSEEVKEIEPRKINLIKGIYVKSAKYWVIIVQEEDEE